MAEKAYKFRLYPTKQQEKLIRKTCGCTRFVYNVTLEPCLYQALMAFVECLETAHDKARVIYVVHVCFFPPN